MADREPLTWIIPVPEHCSLELQAMAVCDAAIRKLAGDPRAQERVAEWVRLRHGKEEQANG